MNVEASGLQSFFTALVGAEQLPATWLQDGSLPEGFSSALREQIAHLQETQQTLPVSSDQAGLSLLQELAVFSGKNLPAVGEENDIDLESTLQALAKVLKTIGTTEASEDVDELAQLVAEAVVPLQNSSPVAVQASVNPVAPDDAREKQASGPLPLSGFGAKEEKNQTLAPAISPNNQAKEETLKVQQDRTAMAKENLPEVEEKHNDESLPLKKNVSDSHEQEMPKHEQAIPKMAADIALLNRAVAVEKNELAPMGRHFAHPQWGNELSDKIVWMHKQNIPSAELNLNPRHLGPVSIRVDVHQEQTSVAFTTHHAVVKEAIEAAIPRLREMLGSQQLNLVNVDISQQHSEQRQGNNFSQMANDQRSHQNGGQLTENAEPLTIADEIEAGRAIASQGILSLFA
ncbi:flagellar hook-length control protein FliK [Methylomarinum vadi]|uniref:flagellar hook-length control protein FliK n=1 Tax=Methylomarinum vadi TaxID=438855 RepID=UPI0004DFC3B7|nr:flagellar hook-length control protein FliK [Methylomarinum vadi]